MDTKSQAQKHIEGIACERAVDKKTRNIQDLEKSIQKFVDELYRSKTHFLLELLQNADDNQYSKTSQPSFSIEYRERGLRIDCNEDGFTEANVEAICSVGNSTKSTSSPGHRYIGKKGIGFKSVFRIATKVWISSGDYKFVLDRTRPLGMITPAWEDFPETSPEGGTVMYFQLSDDCDEKLLWHQIQSFDASTLIFLARLRELRLVVPTSGQPHERRLRRDKRMHSQATESRIFENDEMILHYLIFHHTAQDMPKEERHSNRSVSDILLAFPMLDNSNSRPPSQMLYTFLPIRDCGFKFLIQADFLLAASREDIDESSPWNQKILRCFPDAFGSAVEYLNNTELRFTWPQYIPRQDEVQKDYRDIITPMIGQLSKRNVLESETGQLRAPSTLTYVPKEYALDNGEPLSVNSTSRTRYLSRKYSHDDKQSFLLIGVKTLKSSDFLRDLHESIHEQAAKDRPPEWHSTLARVILKIMAHDVRHSALFKIPMIPLRDGRWVAANEGRGKLFFPAEGTLPSIPEEAGLMEVHPSAVEDPSRFQLFQQFGAKRYNVAEICQAIVQIHDSSVPPFTTAGTLVSQAVFLFRQLWRCPNGFDLWVATDLDKFCRASEVYLTPLEVGGKRFPALHADYLEAMPQQKDEWRKWLHGELRIPTIPRLVVQVGNHFKLSPEMDLIRNHWPYADFLTLLRDNWSTYSRWLEEKDQPPRPRAWETSRIQLQTQVASFQVKCKGKARACPLGHTMLPSVAQDDGEKLSTYFRVIDIPEPGARSWAFLETFGVMVHPTANAFLQGLETAKDMGHVDNCAWFYAKIQIYAPQDRARVRKAFSENSLIFVPQSPFRQEQWLKPDRCIWSTPKFFKRTATLAENYESCRGLFQDILGVQEVDFQTALTELLATSKSDNLDHFVNLFTYLNKYISTSTRTLISGNAETFKTKPVFPVELKVSGEKPTVHHLGSISAESIWYIADRPHLRDRFRGRIPLLAFDNDQLERMKWIYLLPFMTKRLLSKLVVCKPRSGLKTTLHERLTSLLRGRSKHIVRLIPDDSAERQKAWQELESVEVYSAREVSVEWELRGPSGLVATSLPDFSNAAAVLVEGQLHIYLSQMVIGPETASLELSRTLAGRYEIHQKHSLALCGTLSWRDADVEDQLKRDGISHDQEITPSDVLEEPPLSSDEFSGWPPKPETWFTWGFKVIEAAITRLRKLLHAIRSLIFAPDTVISAVLCLGFFILVRKFYPALDFLRLRFDDWIFKKISNHSSFDTTPGHIIPQTPPPKVPWYPPPVHGTPQETRPAHGAQRTPPPPDYGPVRTTMPPSKPTPTSYTYSSVLQKAFFAQYLPVESLPDRNTLLIIASVIVLLLLAWLDGPNTSDQPAQLEDDAHATDAPSHQSNGDSEAEEWRAKGMEIVEEENDSKDHSDSEEHRVSKEDSVSKEDIPRLEIEEDIKVTSPPLDSNPIHSSTELPLEDDSQPTKENISTTITKEIRRSESSKGFESKNYITITDAPPLSKDESSPQASSAEITQQETSGQLPPAFVNLESASGAVKEAPISKDSEVDSVATDTSMSIPEKANRDSSQKAEGQELTALSDPPQIISITSSTEGDLGEYKSRTTSAPEIHETKAENIVATDASPTKGNAHTAKEPLELTLDNISTPHQSQSFQKLRDEYIDNIDQAIRQPIDKRPTTSVEDHYAGPSTPSLVGEVPFERLDEESVLPNFLSLGGQFERSELMEHSPIRSLKIGSDLSDITVSEERHASGRGGVFAPSDQAEASEFMDYFISRRDEHEFVNTSRGVMYNPSPTTMFVGEDTDEARFLGELYVSQQLNLLLGPNIYHPEEHRTSSTRSRNGHKPFDDKDAAYSTFTIVEQRGMGKPGDLVARAFKMLDLELDETCKFHIQVCVTTGGLHWPFRLSNTQYAKCRDMTLQGKTKLSNVYILARVYHIHTNPQIAFYADPWELYQKGFIALESASTFRGSVSRAARPVFVERPREAVTASEIQRIYHGQRLNSDQIRLLKLETSDDVNSPLKGELVVRSTKKTKDSPAYWAISYVWGSAPTRLSPFQFVVNGVEIPITESLWTCLRRLRSDSVMGYIWADALCINQTDNLEKAMQVRYMGRIYTKADRVIIWMGSNQDRDCHAMTILKKLGGAREAQESGHNEQVQLIDQDKEQVWAFLQRPWFTRTWTIQELVLGRRVAIFYRNAEMEWDDFMDAVLLFEKKLLTKGGLRERYVTPSDPARALHHIRQTWEGRSPEAGGSRLKLPILRLVEMFFYAQASMPRDKLFAMLSMASDTSSEIEGFRPDYESDDATILARYASEFVKRNQALQLLYRAGRVKGSRFSSWIPDIMNHAQRAHYGPTISTWRARGTANTANTANNFIFSAGASRSPNATVTHPGLHPVLDVTGKMFDRIQSHQPLKIGHDATRIAFIEILEEFRQLLSYLQSYPNLSHKKRWRDDVLIQTLIGDAIGPQRGRSRSFLIDNSQEDEVLEYWPSGFEREILAMRSGQDSHEHRSKPAEVQQNINDFWRTATTFLGSIPDAALCVTMKGYVGIVPGVTRQTDKILLVHGAGVPFVVRQGSSRGHYELIGECYIHGIMYYEDTVAGKAGDERVTLV